MAIYFEPGVGGTVTAELVDAPAGEALRRILDQQKKHLGFLAIGDTLVVASQEKLTRLSEHPEDYLPSAGTMRMEFILEEAPAAKVVSFLSTEYPSVKFSSHPTTNGLYARGTKSELLQTRRELSNLDRLPEPPPPPCASRLCE